jgi:hypothetical protein
VQIAALSAAGLVATVVFLHFTNAAWYLRLLTFFPAAVAAATYLQVRRNTCVSRARTGAFEHEDFSATAALPSDAAASRRVAATISRDSIIFGGVVGLVAAASVLLR